MTLSLRRKAATAIATSSLLVGAGVALSPGTAYAGSNGQQIIACDYLILYGAVRLRLISATHLTAGGGKAR
jgi:hypothetical protein